jgi:hypothetical protein
MGEMPNEAPETLPAAVEEDVEAVAVVAEPTRAIELARPPAVQTAAVAVGGFVFGCATMAVAHRRSVRKAARRAARRPRRASDVLPIVGSRSFLVDVHLIGNRD